MKPVWVCEEKEHNAYCSCGENLRKQLQQWEAELVEQHPSWEHKIVKPDIRTFPLYPCPYCGAPCEPDMVDIGVGLQQCGPSYCVRCKASEIGPEILDGLKMSWLEAVTGWYEPGKPVSPLANTFGGLLVDHKDAKRLYDRGLLDPKGK